MKCVIEGQAYFNGDSAEKDDDHEVKIEVLGAPDEELEPWEILLVHPRFSLKLTRSELSAVLRFFNVEVGS